MNRRSAFRRLVTASAGSFFWQLSPAVPRDDQREDYILRSDVALVLLDVSVKDSEGRFVPGLVKDNFTVLEDGKPQKINVLDSEDRPVTIGILVDESLSMTPKRPDVLTAGRNVDRRKQPAG